MTIYKTPYLVYGASSRLNVTTILAKIYETNFSVTGLSMNVLRVSNKSPVQERFFKIAQAIYYLPYGFWVGCIISVIL